MPGYPVGKQQGSARHKKEDGHDDEDDPGPSLVETERDVAADVKRQKNDREQGCYGQCVVLHVASFRSSGGGNRVRRWYRRHHWPTRAIQKCLSAATFVRLRGDEPSSLARGHGDHSGLRDAVEVRRCALPLKSAT